MIYLIKRFIKRLRCKHQYRCMNSESKGIFYLMKCENCGHRYLLLNEDDA